MSYVAPTNDPKDKFLFRDFIAELGEEAIGKTLMERYGTWPMYSKFFDYSVPLFHHVHLTFDKAELVGRLGKPEAYYYPPQLNNYPGSFPATYFGFSPEVTPEQVKERLRDYEARDNRITELSRAYRIELGTGWYTPPGVIHAPGSYLTYEPQWNSDVNSVYENVASGEVYPKSFLNENCPEDKMDDVDYIFSLLDWEKNIDPDYRKHYFRPPIVNQKAPEGCVEKWVAYGNDYIGAKELTVLPGRTVVVADEAAYGLIAVQGHGQLGCTPLRPRRFCALASSATTSTLSVRAQPGAGCASRIRAAWNPWSSLSILAPIILICPNKRKRFGGETNGEAVFEFGKPGT